MPHGKRSRWQRAQNHPDLRSGVHPPRARAAAPLQRQQSSVEVQPHSMPFRRMFLALIIVFPASAQTHATAIPPPQRQPPAQSPQLLPDGKVTFRLLAPHATSVELAGDIYQGLPRTGVNLAPHTFIPTTKDPDGLWTGTSTAPFLPGAWRYHFRVDGMDVPDPRNVLSSPYRHGTESLLVTPGDFSETRSVPHGAVARVDYTASTFAAAAREMYIYRPYGYEKGTASCPVFYLIHGGGETDSSWSTVGRAGDILDSLIAAGKAQPMIIVMPAGWTPSAPGHDRRRQQGSLQQRIDPRHHPLRRLPLPHPRRP